LSFELKYHPDVRAIDIPLINSKLRRRIWEDKEKGMKKPIIKLMPMFVVLQKNNTFNPRN
jgi:hypothetical protein